VGESIKPGAQAPGSQKLEKEHPNVIEAWADDFDREYGRVMRVEV
jgi:hypothetical protein